MQPSTPWFALLSALPIAAQSPLVVAPGGAALFRWPVPAQRHQTFFDLTVQTTITLQAIAAPLASPAGQAGTIELWLTNAGVTTHAGFETTPGVWHRAAAGRVVANGETGPLAQLDCESCQDAVGGGGLVLAPGRYGCAVRFLGVANQFAAVPALPAISANAELSLSGGAVQYDAFTTAPAAPGGGYAGWSFSGRIHYALGAVPHACAEAIPYGDGCLRRHASVYGTFATAAAAASALAGKSLAFVPNGIGGYTVLPQPIHPYLPPGPAALQLASSGGEMQLPLTHPFPHAGGLATDLFVHPSGFVSLASNAGMTGASWLPIPSTFLNAPATAWWIWHPFDPGEPGSGSIWYEESGGLAHVTWLGVESGPAGVANPSTFQFVFDPGTGIVAMHFVAIDPIGGASNPPGDRWLVGYSPGGPSPDPGPIDLAAALAGANAVAVLPGSEVSPLQLAASGRPRLGATVQLTTDGAIGPGGGVTLLSTRASDPTVDLAPLGAPGCAAAVDVTAGVGWLLANPGPGALASVALPIPSTAGLLGLRVHAQSAWFDATAHALGLVTSNGLHLQLGTR